jgi:hypothetical protein
MGAFPFDAPASVHPAALAALDPDQAPRARAIRLISLEHVKRLESAGLRIVRTDDAGRDALQSDLYRELFPDIGRRGPR